MKGALSHRARRTGTAAVEMAFVVGLLLLSLIPGIWELSRLADAQQVVSNAAREGARMASTNIKDESEIRAAIVQYLLDNGFDDYTAQASGMITVTNRTQPGVGPKDAAYLDVLEVSIEGVNYKDVSYSPLNIFTNDSTQLSSQAVWVSVKDRVFPDVADPELPTP